MTSLSMLKITALVWADTFAAYCVWMVMVYLTDVWKLNLTRAAAIINIWNGLTLILPLGLSFIADAFLGNFLVLCLSSIAYCIGLGFLSLSTPQAAGICHENRPECISDAQKTLFYFALALISIGISGHLVTIQRFIAEQTEDETDNSAYYKVLVSLCGISNTFYLPYLGGITLFYIKPWSIRFGIPAIVQVLATIVFFSEILSYTCRRLGGSPITTVFRVLFASISKIFHPSSGGELYESSRTNAYKVPRTNGFRCLEKAALILPNKPLEEQRKNRWRLCTVTQVEKIKIILRLLPAWATVIVCGVVSSAGSSFFLETAKNMKPMNIGKLKFTTPAILLLHDASKAIAAMLYTFFAVTVITGTRRKNAAAIGIGTAMVLSTLSCIAAAKIEARRLDVIARHGLADKPDASIPMAMGWLVFQYILNGAAYGVAAQSMYMVFYTQAPLRWRLFLVRITNGFLGLGFIGAVAVVRAAAMVSENRGGPGRSWFQSTSNQSRLDNYYWTLAVMSAVNLMLCFLVPIGYSFQDFSTENEEMENRDYYLEEDDESDIAEVAENCCDLISSYCS